MPGKAWKHIGVSGGDPIELCFLEAVGGGKGQCLGAGGRRLLQ